MANPFSISGLKTKVFTWLAKGTLETYIAKRDLRSSNLSSWAKQNPVRVVKASIADWQRAMAAATAQDNPSRLPLYSIYERILFDEVVQATMDNRILRVTQSRFRWVDKNKKVNEELTLLFEQTWFYDFIKYAMESRFFGHSLMEATEVDAKGNITNLELVNRRHVKPDLGIVVKEEGDTKGEDYRTPPISQWVFEVGDHRDLGILCKVVPFVLLKNPSLQAWGIYTEKFGMPIRSVKTQNTDKKRLDELANMLETMGVDLWMLLIGDEEMVLTETQNAKGWENYREFMNFIRQAIAIIILGNDATISTKDNTGTYSSISAMAELQEYRHWDDKTFVKNVINSFRERFALFGYKVTDLTFEWDEFEEMSVQDMIDAIPKIAPHAELDWKLIAEKTGIPILGPKQIDTTGNEDDPLKK